MKQLASDKIALVLGCLFSLILCISIYYEFMWLALLPAAIVLAWWGVKRMDLFMGALLIAVPLSLNMQEFSYNLPGLYLPTEPMLIVLLGIFLIRSCTGYPVDSKLFKHPV